MNSQWTSEVPTKNGDYWMTYYHHSTKTIHEPQVVHVYGMEHGKGNVLLHNGNSPKIANFVKQYPGAMWCEVIPPPPVPATEGDVK